MAQRTLRHSISFFRRSSRFVLALIGILIYGVFVPSPAHAASITVTTTVDTLDVGTCSTLTLAKLSGSDGQTSLREAICAANDTAGADTSTFFINGTFAIPRSDNENAANLGDFNLLTDITIIGNGTTNTIIDALDQDRVFDIDPLDNCNSSTSCTINFSNMIIRSGNANRSKFNTGGGMYIGSRANVTISNSIVESSTATTSLLLLWATTWYGKRDCVRSSDGGNKQSRA